MRICLLALLLFFPNVHSFASSSIACSGPFQDGGLLSVERIDASLKKHGEWLIKHQSDYSTDAAQDDPLKANYCGANLSGLQLPDRNFQLASFESANLAGVDLSNSILRSANFSFADLTDARMSNVEAASASFVGATLDGAEFVQANLQDADIQGSSAKVANFYQAILKGARLIENDLSEASFVDSDLTGVQLAGSDLYRMVYEVEEGKHPDIHKMPWIKNLHLVKYQESPSALVELRDLMGKSGLIDYERDLTYAIRKEINDRKTDFSKYFEYLFFDLTSQYGRDPWRPAIIIFVLIPVFSLLYALAILFAKDAGIWKAWPKDRIFQNEGSDVPEKIAPKFTSATFYSVYFSLLSAFHIGWNGLNLSNWVIQLQSREYVLHANGWVRTASGTQSIISVYLLALWVLSYFGRPFN